MQQAIEDQLNEMRQNGEKLLSYVYNPWSSPCKILESLFELLKRDYSNIKYTQNENLRLAIHKIIRIIESVLLRQ